MIKIAVPAGKYVVAVSGGVDSMVLLDLLVKSLELRAKSQEPSTLSSQLSAPDSAELIIAHFDHGIRPDSAEDRKLVQQAAAQYGLPFIYEEGGLGPQTSEARAREARYAFLRRVKAEQQAAAIITAHHQDDMLETAIINVLRGTGRKGLSSMQTGGDVIRPLLHVTKADIYDYARRHHITWREDVTNTDDQYLRNYIRQHVLDKLGDYGRSLLLEYIAKAAEANPLIDTILLQDIQQHTDDHGLDRSWFISLPYDVSAEVMAAWLRVHEIREFDRKRIARLVVAAKTNQANKKVDINAGYWLDIGKTKLQVAPRTAS